VKPSVFGESGGDGKDRVVFSSSTAGGGAAATGAR